MCGTIEQTTFMKYQVPQFIEVEDKIFGPLTLKQFLYIAGGAALGFIIWSAIPVKFIAIIAALPVVVFFLAMAFYQVNGRPLIATVESAVRYFLSSKLYIWHKTEKKPTAQSTNTEKTAENAGLDNFVPKLSDSKLKELTWSLDINEKLGDSSRTSEKFRV